MKIRKNIVNLSIIVLTAGSLVVILFTTQGLDQLYELLQRMKWEWIALAVGVMMIYYVLDAMILHSITKLLDRRQRFGRSARLSMIGHFFNSVTPFASGGQPVQAYCMIKEGIEPARAVSVLVLKSMLFQGVVLCYTIIAFVFNAKLIRPMVPGFTTLFVVGASVNALLIVLYALVLFNHGIAERIVDLVFRLLSAVRIVKKPDAIKARIKGQMDLFRESAQIYRRHWRGAVVLVVLETARLTAQFSVPFFMYRALETGPISFANMLAAISVLTVISTLFPTPGGSGGAEGVGYIFFRNFFVTTPVVPVILLWRVLTYYIHIVFGGLISLVSPEKPLTEWRERDSATPPSYRASAAPLDSSHGGPQQPARQLLQDKGASGRADTESRVLTAAIGAGMRR